MKLGLFGGTFNPIHYGHLKAAEEILESIKLDKICFIPSNIPPHKDANNLIAPHHRLRMIELAIKNNKKLSVSDYEIKKGEISYTIDTLKYFKKETHDSDLYFIVGNDIFNTIETWKEYKSLFEISNFIVMIRPGFSEESEYLPVALSDLFRYHESNIHKTVYINKSSRLIIKLKIQGLEISSSQIRHFVSSSKSVNNLVPPEVENYMLENKLYN